MSVKWSFGGQCKEKATNTAAIPVLIRLGAHPPDGRLRLAFQCPTWGWEVLAFATHAKGLTGFIFLFLQRPPLQPPVTLDAFAQAAMAEIERREGYEQQLLAGLRACTALIR